MDKGNTRALKYNITIENVKETPKYKTGNKNLAISQCRVRNGKKMNEKDIRKKANSLAEK